MNPTQSSMEPREGYGPGPLVGRTVVSGGNENEKVTGVIVGQAGPFIDVRWSDGDVTWSDSRLFEGLCDD